MRHPFHLLHHLLVFFNILIYWWYPKFYRLEFYRILFATQDWHKTNTRRQSRIYIFWCKFSYFGYSLIKEKKLCIHFLNMRKKNAETCLSIREKPFLSTSKESIEGDGIILFYYGKSTFKRDIVAFCIKGTNIYS